MKVGTVGPAPEGEEGREHRQQESLLGLGKSCELGEDLGDESHWGILGLWICCGNYPLPRMPLLTLPP